jgi:hypothetical protein
MAGLGSFLTAARLSEQIAGEHPYGYALNNPITYTDPSGMQIAIPPPGPWDLDPPIAICHVVLVCAVVVWVCYHPTPIAIGPIRPPWHRPAPPIPISPPIFGANFSTLSYC